MAVWVCTLPVGRAQKSCKQGHQGSILTRCSNPVSGFLSMQRSSRFLRFLQMSELLTLITSHAILLRKLLYPWSHSFDHFPKLSTISDGWIAKLCLPDKLVLHRNVSNISKLLLLTSINCGNELVQIWNGKIDQLWVNYVPSMIMTDQIGSFFWSNIQGSRPTTNTETLKMSILTLLLQLFPCGHC